MDDAQTQKAGPFAERMNTRYDQDMGKLKGLSKDEQAKRIAALAEPHYDEGMQGLGRSSSRPRSTGSTRSSSSSGGRWPCSNRRSPRPSSSPTPRPRRSPRSSPTPGTEQGEAVKAAKNDMQAAAPKIQSLAKESATQSTAVLKPEQLRTWQTIYGRPISPPAAEAAAPR